MAAVVTTTTGITELYQKHYSKKMLETVKQLTVLDQFAEKPTLPERAGASGATAKTITFIRRVPSANNSSGVVADVLSLSEGVAPTTFANHTYATVQCVLAQIGEVGKISDIATRTHMLNLVKDLSDKFADDCALQCDNIIRNVIVAGLATTGRFYAQATTSFSTLAAATTSAGKAVASDFLDVATRLMINRAPTYGGYYIAAVPPEVQRDILDDPDWQESANYGDPSRRFKGELGTYGAVKFVSTTNGFQEDGTGSEGTYAVASAAANKIFRTLVFGKEAFGAPVLAGDKITAPKLIINDKPDKSDPLNQNIIVGWKSFWNAVVLNDAFVCSLSSKSSFSA